MKYAAIIIDLVKSRQFDLTDRNTLQLFLKSSISSLNKLFKPSIEKEVMFSAGDEVQGLFKHALAGTMYFRLLKILLFPTEIRAGIGTGEVSVKMDSSLSTEQDGVAYYNAREAIKIASEKNITLVYMSKEKEDKYINTMLDLISALEDKQSPQQKQISLLVELLDPLFNETLMDIKEMDKLAELLKLKEQIVMSKMNDGEKPINWETNFMIKEHEQPYYFENRNKRTTPKDTPILESTLMRGIGQQIANIRGTSPQTINKSLKAGYTDEIRKGYIALFQLLEEIEEERSYL